MAPKAEYIILDTNILCRSFYLDNNEWKTLIQKGDGISFKIIIPEFIVRETVKKYKDGLREDKIMSCIEKARSRYKLDVPEMDENKVVEEYEAKLKELFREHGILMVPYPSEGNLMRRLSERYFEGRKPFSQNADKKSFPDAIIWLSVMDIANSEQGDCCIHFITNNFKDFAKDGENKNEFHDDFQDEIQYLGSKSIKLYNSITSFLEQFGDQTEEQKRITQYMESIKSIKENRGICHLVIDNNLLQRHLEVYLYYAHFYNPMGASYAGWGEEVFFHKEDVVFHKSSVVYDTDFSGYVVFEGSVDIRKDRTICRIKKNVDKRAKKLIFLPRYPHDSLCCALFFVFWTQQIKHLGSASVQ